MKMLVKAAYSCLNFPKKPLRNPDYAPESSAFFWLHMQVFFSECATTPGLLLRPNEK